MLHIYIVKRRRLSFTHNSLVHSRVSLSASSNIIGSLVIIYHEAISGEHWWIMHIIAQGKMIAASTS